jgi:hypothetical protein
VLVVEGKDDPTPAPLQDYRDPQIQVVAAEVEVTHPVLVVTEDRELLLFVIKFKN